MKYLVGQIGIWTRSFLSEDILPLFFSNFKKILCTVCHIFIINSITRKMLSLKRFRSCWSHPITWKDKAAMDIQS